MNQGKVSTSNKYCKIGFDEIFHSRFSSLKTHTFLLFILSLSLKVSKVTISRCKINCRHSNLFNIFAYLLDNS